VALLILLRHGQSTWNLENRFTGWVDVDLTPTGESEARLAGERMANAELHPDVVFTSVLTRAIRTSDIALAAMGRSWIPTYRHWRLNERHYGALQGLDKAETAELHGADQVKLWRRSYDVAPPPIDSNNPMHPTHDSRYRLVAPELLPGTECLKDVLERMLPFWYDGIAPELLQGRNVLVSAHGNSLRAMVKHLEHLSDEAILEYEIANGIPIVYQMSDRLTVDNRDILQ
jgi:2,3-bisphosphoglycerate-dependent phosphoglycerate mutase